MDSKHNDNPAERSARAARGWLTIEEACKLLGVDQSTLRRWSDSGKVPVVRTPGGHRRYNEDDLRALMRGESRPRRRMSRQALTDLSISAYESDYISQARTRGWYTAYDRGQMDELRQMGRRLVDLASRATSGRAERRQIDEEARAIGRRYGAISAEAGLAVDDAVEAFLFFRYPVIQTIARFIESEDLSQKRAGRVFADVSQFLDQVLIATVTAYTDLRGS
jgi:excisionase family DNA binding protein